MPQFHIPPLNQAIKPRLQDKIDQKTKPLGALGELEVLALKIGLIQQTESPVLNKPVMFVFAADHGIANSGVSPYPQAVTAQMVLNFLNGGAAINIFAKQHGLMLKVVDAGVNYIFERQHHLVDASIAKGTANFLEQPAMTSIQCEQAVNAGAALIGEQIDAGSNMVAFGEMGIGNTSSASCLMSLLCDLPIAHCVGRGTGLDDAGVAKKTAMLSEAISKHAVNKQEVMQVLQIFGGFEIAMIVGGMLHAAERKAVILVDGFITTAALLVANALHENITEYCVFSHCSGEAGHQAMLDYLGAKPLLNLGLRLGEGTGAALAYPLVKTSVSFLNEMASFESASVSGKTDA